MRPIVNYCKYIIATFFALSLGLQANAQVSAPASMYFLNEYLYNPALTGKSSGVNVGISYQNNLTGSSGETLGNAISAEYGKGRNGFGLLLNSTNEGLLKQNKFLASYAYQLPMSDVSDLRFGFSLGLATLKMNTSGILGDVTDELVQKYLNGSSELGAAFAVDYTLNGVHASAVLPNITNLVRSEGDLSPIADNKFLLALSYNFINNDIKYVPKVMYRNIIGYGNAIDAGVNVQFAEDTFNILAMYHTTKNLSFGLGFKIFEKYNLQAAYNLPISGNTKKYTYGAVELGLKAYLTK